MKGDPSSPRTSEVFFLLNIGSKIPFIIVVKRTQALTEQMASGMQAGFRPERSAIDGLFAVMMGLKKRQEHGLDSYGDTWTWSRRSGR